MKTLKQNIGAILFFAAVTAFILFVGINCILYVA